MAPASSTGRRTVTHVLHLCCLCVIFDLCRTEAASVEKMVTKFLKAGIKPDQVN